MNDGYDWRDYGKFGYAFTWLGNPMAGAWEVNVITDAYPQKVATALGELGENLLGCTYEPIAYLGKQIVNGVNHAVLAKQTLVTGVDHSRIVLLKFNEKGMDCTLYAIETLLDCGGNFGGYTIDPKTGDDIPADAIEAFKSVTNGWIGAKIEPVALLAQKVVKGIDFIFLATVTPVYPDAKATAKIVAVNSLTNTIDFIDIF